ncbi:hypothetical protein GW17_00061784, partial [Ensete ventricosum]
YARRNRAIRIWDESLAESDQIGIARVIAKTVEHEKPGLVFCGAQSADHGHAQTGIAVAGLLGWAHAAVVSGLDYVPGAPLATIDRELEGGLVQKLSIETPAVLTIQLGINKPRYASLRSIKQANAKPIDVLSPAEIGLDPSQTGLAGSLSRVRRMYIPERGRSVMIEGAPAEQAARILEIVKEAIGAAEQIKFGAGGPVSVLVVAPDPEKYSAALSVGCVDEVILARSAAAEEFEPHLVQAALRQVISERAPSVVLIPHSVDGCGVAPALASALEAGSASDVFALHYDGAELIATRAAYKEKVFVELEFPGKASVILTLRSGAFQAAAAPAQARETPIEVDFTAGPHSKHLGWKDPPPNGGIDIPGASFILSIGRGVGDEANVEQFLELADSLGATLGCSRPIADNGWLPKARQVGQSGQLAAKCKLYIAMGISGSVQHQWGMKHVETIIAVNKDPEASIFSVAKFGVVGDMLEIAEELQKQIVTAS